MMKRFFLLALALALGPAMAIAEPFDLPTHIKEGSNSFLSVTFKDQNGAIVVPQSVAWYLSDEATGTMLLQDTDVATPNSTMTFDFSTCACRILNTTKNTENRIVAVYFTYGGTGQYEGTEYARFVCENIPSLYVKGDCSVEQVATPTASPTQTPTRTPG